MQKLALIILDGWGIGKLNEHNAIHMAKTPFMDKISAEYPYTQLQASHEYVGLPHGQIGGSEVGHLTIGAGRVFFQDLPRISRALENPNDPTEGIIQKHTFQEFLMIAKAKTVHLIGMVSPGGIHSHQDHLHKLLEIMHEQGCMSPIIHFISDGRDTLPQSGATYAKQLLDKMNELHYGKVVDVTGRFYAMDRDKNWDRTAKAVDVMAHGKGVKEKPDLMSAFTDNYAEGLSDEMQEATRVDITFTGIGAGEPLFFFDFRSDRMKQIVTKIHEVFPNNPTFTMTQYDQSFTYPVFFEKKHLTETLGEVVSKAGIPQIRAAETDKIPHVTYFFNGGVEQVFPGEEHVFMESTKVTYDKTPEMRAKDIVDGVIKHIEDKPAIGFGVINFANADLVGHFGVFESVVVACETVDRELARLCEYLTKKGFVCVITADHGNADEMVDEATGQPKTSHTLNPVPFIIYAPNHPKLRALQLDQNPDNGLSKVAGTVLEIMGLTKPTHDYDSLIVRK
ncbi:MAG TPA: 2,3-bisphosphoglycerate-independent phosphoglycerate mutase [Candidatus Woesebacteria bacterium]|nr:2,3-bisphosphoglycerate-independent phosphoglycerate mutase [Candidatus Woesebacteria bacterium]HNS94883.1 2,3-bisphosphoglycerate-independent phosphoglycerate mutase [Candidatus Woesebacteria bacterium]